LVSVLNFTIPLPHKWRSSALIAMLATSDKFEPT